MQRAIVPKAPPSRVQLKRARVALILQTAAAARMLLLPGSYNLTGRLSPQVLQQVEDALAKYSHLLADDVDFKAMGPLQRLADIGEN